MGRAVVNGGGIAGLASAIGLATQGWQVTVLERAPAPRSGGFVIDFFGPGFDAAERLGVLDEARRYALRYAAARYVTPGGRTTGRLPLSAFLAATGDRYFSIQRGDLERALRDSLPSEAVDLRYGVSVVDVDDDADSARVTLSDGSTAEVDLLVGADGLHSTVRGLIGLAETDVVRPLGFAVAATTFDDPALTGQVGDEALLTDRLGSAAGVFALDLGRPADHPARAGRAAVFLVAPHEGLRPPADGSAWLRAGLADHGPLVADLADRVPDEVYCDVVAQSVAPRWHSGRVVLVGDAAHAVSLLAGQGASLAIAGAEALATSVGASSGAGDVPGALARYERSWRPVVEPVQAAGRRAASTFVPTGQIALWARRAVLQLIRIPLVSRLVGSRVLAGGTH